jgi:O-antigen/teichoic acid export membrane protein
VKFRSIFNLVLGTGAAQIIIFLSYPLLSRIYTPDDFGVYGGVMGIVSVLAALMTARADKLILFTVDRDSRAHLLIAFTALTAAVAIFAALLTPLARTWLHNITPGLAISAVLIACATAWVNILVGVHASALKTQWIVKSSFLRNFISVGVQVSLAFAIGSEWGLVIGSAAGVIAAVLFLFRAGRLEGLLHPIGRLDKQRIVTALRAYTEHLVWGAGQGLFATMTNAAPIIFSIANFSPATAGIYALAERLVRAPVNIVATTIRGYVAVHSRQDDGTLDFRFMILLSLALGGSAAIASIPITLYSVPLTTLYLGSNWAETGRILEVLWWYVVISFTVLPWQAYLLSIGRSRDLIFMEVIFFLCRIVPIVAMGASLTLSGLAWIVVLSYLAYNLLYLGYFAAAYRRGTLVLNLQPGTLASKARGR